MSQRRSKVYSQVGKGIRYAGWILAATMLFSACRAAVLDPTTAPPSGEEQPTPHPATGLPAAGSTAVGEEAALPTETPPPQTAAPTATAIPISDALADIEFRLPPAVQHTTETTAELYFELAAPAEGILIVWPQEDSTTQRAVPFTSMLNGQTIVLESLDPGVRYMAQVVLPGADGYEQPPYEGEAWGAVSFRTAGGEREGEPLFRAGVIGDSGFGDSVTYQLAEEMAAYDLDFVIQTGDAVYRMYEEDSPYASYARKWFLPLEPLLKTGPVYPVVGNHDIEPDARVDGTPFYYTVFPPLAITDSPAGPAGGRQWYAVERGSMQILLLDSQTFFGEAGRDEQADWLTTRLADTRFAHTITAHHVPPFTSGLHPDDGWPVQQAWVPQYEASNVRLSLSGHDHNYERLEQNGVTYLVSGGGSATLYAQSITQPQSVVFAQRSHFVLLEAWPDRIDFLAVAVGGEVLDEGTIPLP